MFSLTSTVASAKLTSKVRTVEPILRARSRFACASSTTLSEIFLFCFLIAALKNWEKKWLRLHERPDDLMEI